MTEFRPTRFEILPVVIKNLLIINVLFFLAQNTIGNSSFINMENLFALHHVKSPLFQPWQIITHLFMHGSMGHLFFNALALYQFGGRLEDVWGPKRYALFFFVCVVGAGLCQLGVSTWMYDPATGPIPTIGASGGIYGLLLAYGMLFPRDRVMLLIPPIPMTARTLVIVFGAIELVMGVTGTAAGIAHFAHLGGMLFGWLLIRYWRGQPPFSKRRPPPPKFRVVR